ncbi:MAG: adenylate/guanylate cyclase domain-containing protein [Geminicoccaceae bacterium]|nr:adenylate/guanylate cyclase domain-containing protein [Geminicoccaceae bacterium]
MDEVTARIERWLLEAGLAGRSERTLLGGLSDRLVEAGVPLWRSFFGLDTLHPIVGGRMAAWQRPDGEAEESEYPRTEEEPEDWLTSPLYVLDQSERSWLRWNIEELEPGRFPLLDRVRREGGRDYVAFQTDFHDPEPMGTMEEMYTSWTSDIRFDDRDIALIEGLLPAFALAIKSVTIARTARSLLATYLGAGAARRVYSGDIERGKTQTVRAIIWFSDLKGFTKIADQYHRDELVPLLNAYSDCLVQAIHSHGGDVLKFMGDGLLGTFELTDGGDACSRALEAVLAAKADVDRLNERRTDDGLPTTGVDFALHVGDVLYGNIGSRDRLDFTVVGPAVNEASRLESMCDALDQRVVISEAFAAAEPGCRDRLISLGRYMLRGVRRPQELFTLDPDRLT